MRSRSSSINAAACAAADAAPFVGADAVLETDDRRDANSTILRSAGDAGDARTSGESMDDATDGTSGESGVGGASGGARMGTSPLGGAGGAFPRLSIASCMSRTTWATLTMYGARNRAWLSFNAA